MDTLLDFFVILNRYLHIICATVIVGGTLFFELIVPVATGELKQEQQLLVFGRARWRFKTMVWTCAVLLVLTGIMSTVRRWHDYSDPVIPRPDASEPTSHAISDVRRPGWWWAAHVSTGMVALIFAASLMTVRRPPDYPLYWMRLSLTILLVVIFFGTTARHMRLSLYEIEHTTRTPE
jgi:putative copper export protein